MAKGADVRALVRKHYVFDLMSLEMAASAANVAYTTAKRWRDKAAAEGDDWEKVRSAATFNSKRSNTCAPSSFWLWCRKPKLS